MGGLSLHTACRYSSQNTDQTISTQVRGKCVMLHVESIISLFEPRVHTYSDNFELIVNNKVSLISVQCGSSLRIFYHLPGLKFI